MNISNVYTFVVHYNYQYQQCHLVGLCLCTFGRLQKLCILTQKVFLQCDKLLVHSLWKQGVDYGAFDCWTLVEEIWTCMYGNCVLMLVTCAWQTHSII